MAIYYSIETEGKTKDNFKTESEVCQYIRAKRITQYTVLKRTIHK